ncbi:curli production assembly protein CsgG [bacterium]|nr:curli production assembly protein CsgG [bacterium]
MRKTVLMSIVFCCGLMFGCATAEKPKISKLPEKHDSTNEVAQQETGKFLKRKIAIARFSNETNYGKGILSNTSNLGKQASDILSTKLVKTGKFILLEREDFDKINEEIKLGNLQTINIPADYLVVGSVAEFGRQTTGDTGVFTKTKRQKAFAKVFVRVIDVSTGEVVYGEYGEGEASVESGTTMGIGPSAGYDSTLNDKAIEAAISKVVNKVINNLLHKPWQSFILDSQEGSFYISGGKTQGIEEGDIFGIYEKGKKVKNPQTGTMIELPSKLVGKLKVLSTAGESTSDEISICKVIDGEITEDFSNYYVRELK